MRMGPLPLPLPVVTTTTIPITVAKKGAAGRLPSMAEKVRKKGAAFMEWTRMECATHKGIGNRHVEQWIAQGYLVHHLTKRFQEQ